MSISQIVQIEKQIFLFVYRFFDKKVLEDIWRILYNFFKEKNYLL